MLTQIKNIVSPFYDPENHIASSREAPLPANIRDVTETNAETPLVSVKTPCEIINSTVPVIKVIKEDNHKIPDNTIKNNNNRVKKFFTNTVQNVKRFIANTIQKVKNNIF